jgi:hypothetical protein
MNAKRMVIIDASVLGLAALGYGVYWYSKNRRANRLNAEKTNERHEASIES